MSDLDFKQEICKALGLTGVIQSIVIKVYPEDAVMIETKQFMQDKQAKKLKKVLKRYHLVENVKNEKK